ncbi:YafY family protein [Paucibacter sp. R3-3]|uniref:YafY family protein n=1 Tax=Roseateles agri TaxID=3098619 RepID=A0ABU5D9A6_9BURK|nr:YafY family protein [Paucibacter sp. R3-3]MDY0742870.1 YafY family protein [Paucibacter sp. R3-3]
MQASRLLSILMLLQGRGRVSAQALARELEVSVRTIYRDVDRLSASGVPIWADTGRNGGFQLREGWRTKLDGLTAPEAQAMFLAGLPGPAADLGLGEALASAQLKLRAALPPEWQDDAQRVGTRFHLDPVDWYRDAPPVDHLGVIARAVWQAERIAIRYDSWQGETPRRELEPLGLVLKAGIWYVIARSSAARPARTYRLQSILELQALGEPFKRPRSFDLAGYWRESTRRFEAELYRGEARLSVSARGLRLLTHDFSSAVAEAARRSAKPDPEREGWSQLRIPIESAEHAAGQLLRLGPDALVLGPKDLRERMVGLAARLAALYA